MKGYKAFEEGLTNRYGFTYELGKKYYLNGELNWKKNGFHFCTRPEDTLRYIDAYNHPYNICEVNGSGQIVLYEDEYYGFYDMYASSEMEILRIVPREEIFDMVINSYGDRVKRFISLTELTQDEIEQIRERYPYLADTIKYFQDTDFILKRKKRG